jgi:cytochrome c-type biogenesis protein CcmH/NrfG
MRVGRILLAPLLAGLLALLCSFSAAAATASGLVDEADRLWREGKVQQAQQRFEAAVAAQPDAAPVRLRLAGFQLAQQQTSASIASYRQVISQEASNSKAWIGLGLAYLHSGRRELARAAFSEAVRVDPARQEALAPLIANLEAR